MGDNYESENQSEDGRDDDHDEEYEEAGGGNRFLGFMFGNVDNSGDLDVDYLDEDAKEHLAALADKLGSSLTDIDLAVKSAQVSADAAEQDYDEKAEDAVDYEDIDEQYEGPEIQAASEEDYLLPKKEYFSSEVSLATLGPKTSVFDDENYDEEEENDDEKEHVIVDKELEVQTISLSGQQDVEACAGGDKSQDCLQIDSPDTLNLETELEEFLEEDDTGMQPVDGKGSSPLPTLCTEHGAVILRFSEIFAIHEPMKKRGKRESIYSILKEKHMSMDASEIVEEDEEIFLKGSHQVFASSPRAIEHEVCNDDPDIAEFGTAPGPGAFQMSVKHEEQRKDSYLCPESRNDLALDLSFGWQSSLCQNFYPLDQEDWEERILWDNSPVVSDSSQESCDTFEFDTGASFIRETGHLGSENLKLQLPLEIGEKDHNSSLPTSSVLLESFGLGDSPGPENLPYPKSKCHPQLLRLESQLQMDKDDHIGYKRENVALESHRNETIRPFLFTFQNRDLMAGSWVDDIIWEPQKANVKPKLIFNLQDEQMLFEIFDRKDSKHLHLHAGAMVITRSTEPTVSPQLLSHPYQSGWQFNIANDKFYMKRKNSQQLQSSSNKRIACGLKVHHSAPAIKLQTMKLKLSNKDLYNFHRPKALWYPHDNKVAVREQGKLPTLGPMKVILKSLGGKGTKLHVEAEETILSIKAKASKKLDFKPSEGVKIFYSGKELEEHRSLAAQNVQPNALLHLVRTKIHLLPRAQMIPGENKSLCPPGAFKKKSDLSVKDGHVFLMEYCEERPLLLSNVGMGANLCTYYQKSSPSDQTGISLHNGKSSLGTVVGLEPTDKSPFLGDIRAGIRAGCTQSSLETNMYKAPIFPHKVASTDYLLVRSPKGKLSVRRIDRVAVVGQQEPLMEVFSPGSKNLQAYMVNRVLVHMYREFRAAEKRGVLPWVCVDELSAQFPNLSETILRKKLKECAILRKGANARLFWSKKRDFSIPSEDDLKKLVLPENVCAYESMRAGVYHLKHLGITRVMLPTSVSTAVSQLPDEAIALAAASHIERELQITPWNLSGNFVACTNQERDNIERLEINGVGDPSGRGLGFSYVRAATKAPMSNAISKRKPVPGRGGSTVTGTDADLRRLSLEAAREVLLKFNVDEEEIAKHTRWHRIAMIRKLSSEQAASGVKVDHTTIGKYARGQRMSFLQLQQQMREKCQEIWERQVQSLSAIEGDANGSDSEANSDLDSFAGDLENLLDAEEYEGEESSQDCKHEKADGMKGLKMRRRPSLAQAEEEFEDEAAEAAELCRLLMDEDEAEQKKKKLKAPDVGGGLLQGSNLNLVGNAEKVKKTNKSQISGSSALKVNSITNLKEVETAFGKKNMSDKGKAVKRIGTPITLVATKVKILGDGLKIFKEKKLTRESFVCGACGQLGHMRTNKHCPKYGEEPGAQVETSELEKAIGKSNPLDPLIKSQQKLQKKRSMPKFHVKIENSGCDKSALKAIALPMKFICGSTENFSDKNGELVAQSSDQPVTSDVQPAIEMGNRPFTKVNKIIIPNKAKPEDLHKSSIVIRPPADVDNGQIDSCKLAIVIRPRTSDDRDFVESLKSSIMIRSPAVNEREKDRKKIVIKRPKEIVDLDQLTQDGSSDFDYRKTKRIVELSGFEKYGRQKTQNLPGNSAEKKAKEESRWWEEELKRRHAEKLREERAQRMYEEEMRAIQERERLAELRRYEVSTRRERDEECQKSKKQKRKKPEISDDYLENFKRRRNDKRMPERERGAKRRNVDEVGRFGAEYIPATKRRRAGEVGLANVLETIVDALRDRVDVSYLFVMPVSKKEAPDYYDIIRRPMDLSIIKDKVRKMEYKRRDEFRHDVWQISYNAHAYNDGRNPGIPPLADQLLEICDYLLEEYQHSLNEAEAGI